MNLSEAKGLGIAHKDRIRVGRGIGSGRGKTSARGHKGAKSRSGWSSRLGFEGGQMPLFRRIPKRGFNNKIFRIFYTTINVGDLNNFADGAVIELATVLDAGLVSREKHTDKFKVLGDGELSKKLTVRADAFTTSARAKIEAAGGKVELLPKVEYRPKFVRKGETKPRPKKVKKDPKAKK